MPTARAPAVAQELGALVWPDQPCAGVAPAAKIVGKNGAHPLTCSSSQVDQPTGSFNMMRLATEAMSANTPEPTGERGVMITSR